MVTRVTSPTKNFMRFKRNTDGWEPVTSIAWGEKTIFKIMSPVDNNIPFFSLGLVGCVKLSFQPRKPREKLLASKKISILLCIFVSYRNFCTLVKVNCMPSSSYSAKVLNLTLMFCDNGCRLHQASVAVVAIWSFPLKRSWSIAHTSSCQLIAKWLYRRHTMLWKYLLLLCWFGKLIKSRCHFL